MSSDAPLVLQSHQTVDELNAILDTHYRWCDDAVFEQPAAMTWYVSEEKSEPRFGVDGPHFSTQHRLPLDTARQIVALRQALVGCDVLKTIAAFLSENPNHRRAILRAQMVAYRPYGEIRDDIASHRTRPIDMLRCKLSFFGADGFDPKSDRWTRVRLFAGAPCLADLNSENAGDGFLFPALPKAVEQDTSNPVPA